MPRVDPVALLERRVGGVTEVVKRLRERLRAELWPRGGGSGGERNLRYTRPCPVRLSSNPCVTLLGGDGLVGSMLVVQLPQVDTLSVAEARRVRVERAAAVYSSEHDEE